MSLEQALAENTAAVRDLTKLMARMYGDSQYIDAVAYREAKAIEAEPEQQATQATVVTNGASNTPSSSPVTPFSAEVVAQKPATGSGLTTAPVAESVSYQDASKAILKLSASKGRDVAVGLLGKFGAANLKEVKPEQYAAVLAAATEALS